MRFPATAIFVAAFIGSTVFAQTTKPAGAKVTLKKLVEKREFSLDKSPFAGWENGIELTLHIDGADVKGAAKVGKLKITKAIDDAGTDLTKAPKDVPQREMENYEDVREPQSFNSGPKPTGFDLDMKLPVTAARSAKTIKQLSASVQVLVGGEKKVVTVKEIKKNYGKTIADPALKSLGIEFTLVDPAKRGSGMMMGDANSSLSATLAGKLDTLGEVRIVDASGEKLNSGSSWSDDSGKREITYQLSKPLADDMTLQIEVWPGQKTVTVPIEMKDVKLP